jgi:hypothetical protein
MVVAKDCTVKQYFSREDAEDQNLTSDFDNYGPPKNTADTENQEADLAFIELFN